MKPRSKRGFIFYSKMTSVLKKHKVRVVSLELLVTITKPPTRIGKPIIFVTIV